MKPFLYAHTKMGRVTEHFNSIIWPAAGMADSRPFGAQKGGIIFLYARAGICFCMHHLFCMRIQKSVSYSEIQDLGYGVDPYMIHFFVFEHKKIKSYTK